MAYLQSYYDDSSFELDRELQHLQLDKFEYFWTSEQYCQKVAQAVGLHTNSRQRGQAAYTQCLEQERASDMRYQNLTRPYQPVPQPTPPKQDTENKSWWPW